MGPALLIIVSNRTIISSAFIAMGPGPVVIARLGAMQKKLSPVSSHNNGSIPFNDYGPLGRLGPKTSGPLNVLSLGPCWAQAGTNFDQSYWVRVVIMT